MQNYVYDFNDYLMNEDHSALSTHYKQRIDERLGDKLEIISKFNINAEDDVLKKYLTKVLAELAMEVVPSMNLSKYGKYGIRTGQIFITENHDRKPILLEVTGDNGQNYQGDDFLFIHKDGILVTILIINHAKQDQQISDMLGMYGQKHKRDRVPYNVIYLTRSKEFVVNLDDMKYTLFQQSLKAQQMTKIVLDRREPKEMTLPPGKVIKFHNKAGLQEREIMNYEFDELRNNELSIYFTNRGRKILRKGDTIQMKPQSVSKSDIVKLKELLGDKTDINDVDLDNLEFKGKIYEIRKYDGENRKNKQEYTTTEGKPTIKSVPGVLIWATEVSW